MHTGGILGPAASLLLLCLCALPARAQKMDRGIDMSSQPVFIEKGTWMVGGGASYSLHNNDNATFLVVQGVNSMGYNISLSPAVCYMFKDNLGAGVRIGYSRDMLKLDSGGVNFGDIGVSVSDYHNLTQSFELQGIGRYYIPVGNSRRIALFNEVQLGGSYGQGKVMDGHGNRVNGSYETVKALQLSVCPGFMAFVTDHLALDVSVNMLGLHFKWTDQIHNQVDTGSRSTTFINFKINLLAIGFSLYYYI